VEIRGVVVLFEVESGQWLSFIGDNLLSLLFKALGIDEFFIDN
jgi:hypothetical protein